MRRVPAIVLLALISFSLLTPAFSTNSDSNLPACCRRDGKHHCSMAIAGDAQPGAAFRSNAKCAMYPPGVFYTPTGVSGLAAPSAPSLESPLIGRAIEAHGSLAELPFLGTKAHHKRGPPSFS